MLADAIELLDRRYRLAAKICADDPKQILTQAFAFWSFLQSEPRLAAAYEDVTNACFRDITAYRERDADLARQLRDIRIELVRANPDKDDSSHPPPGINQIDAAYARSLAMFDRKFAESQGLRLGLLDDTDPELLSSDLLRILSSKFDVEGEPEQDAPFGPPRELASNVERLRRDWILFTRTSMSVATVRLYLVQDFVRAHPDDVVATPSDILRARLNQLMHPLYGMRGVLFGDAPRKFELERESEMPGIVVGLLERAYEAVRAQLGTVRSHRSAVERFRLRAQLYDAEELRALASSRRRGEDALTDRLARVLFDQGLNPLTRPLLGGLEPDLLDRGPNWTFYVEAKQYDSSRGRTTIVSGMRQIWDTLARIQGYPHRVHEAFYVVFRRGGPRYVLPEELRSEGVTVYPVLVDIAPTRVSGARQKAKPIVIPAADLMPTRSRR